MVGKVQISKELKEKNLENKLYFKDYKNGVVMIETSRNDFSSDKHLCQAISDIIEENSVLELVTCSVLNSSLGLDGAILVFKDK